MDEAFLSACRKNSQVYKDSLDRIIEKYSKLHYLCEGKDVDLGIANLQKLSKHLEKIEKTLSDTSKSQTDLEDALNSTQDITGGAQELNFSRIDGELDENACSSNNPADDFGSTGNATQLSFSSLEDSQKGLPDVEQDEDLQMSLNSNSSSLMDIYPSMINRIGQAWHQQRRSCLANAVLRKYRMLRKNLNRSSSRNSSVHPSTCTNDNPTYKDKNPNSPVKSQLFRSAATVSPIKTVHTLRGVQSPSKDTMMRTKGRPITVMDFSDSEISLNKTFTLSEYSPPHQSQRCFHTTTTTHSPAQPGRSATKASTMSPLPKYKRLSSSSPNARDSTCPPDIDLVRRISIGSPLRQSPLKAQMRSSLSESPHRFNRNPGMDVMERGFRRTEKPKWVCSSSSCPSQKFSGLSKVPIYNSQSSFQRQLISPQRPIVTNDRHRLKRHLSFDSTQPPRPSSTQQVDTEFRRLFHKFVCLSKSSVFQDYACSLCARNQSSSVVAALALSPHCSNQRKRHREVELGTDHQSKRFQVECCMPSPGSKRLVNANLRRCLYAANPSHNLI